MAKNNDTFKKRLAEAGAEIHELRKLRAVRALPVPDSACRILGSAIYDLNILGKYRFTLRTTSKGVEVMMHIACDANSGLSWNLSDFRNYWPCNFKEARRWVNSYTAGYGQKAEEVMKKRWPRMKGSDRQLFREGGVSEKWLSSDVPELFAEAAIRCVHAGGFCLEDGFCHYRDCDMVLLPTPNKKEQRDG